MSTNKDQQYDIRLARLCSPAGLEAQPELALACWDGARPRHATGVRLGLLGDRLLVAFRCAYDRLHADPALPRDRSVPRLWELDVVEVFIAEGTGGGYREYEATPLGQWLALAFRAPRVADEAAPELVPEVRADVAAAEYRVWLSLPWEAGFARIGLFRVHGREPGREYQAYRPTGGSRPDFHRPERWAALVAGGPAAQGAA